MIVLAGGFIFSFASIGSPFVIINTSLERVREFEDRASNVHDVRSRDNCGMGGSAWRRKVEESQRKRARRVPSVSRIAYQSARAAVFPVLHSKKFFGNLNRWTFLVRYRARSALR